MIDAQKGFLESDYWGKRNNPNLEKNIEHLLKIYRELKLPVLHVQHLSTEEKSPLSPGQKGVEFISELEPEFGERIFQKSVNSAFIGTNLEKYLKSNKIKSLTMAGFTSDHCVSTTARMASNLGFDVLIAHDATATFDRIGIDGAIHPAELVHQISLASLDKEFANILSCYELETNLFFPTKF
ncbi:cysteine hydrolase family protein [Bacteriovorax sp. PP10]|uniref:Cysteine hydrolase family protein n=1 Tax=Bacteriovorax antarcticus TaxID=3088717 RepID=A0ABU5VSE8_9BACT|nr:cysteine hydrolase family protein [Bacteriovorax sp. PP10]MEA9355972.1 cysteine hydrolase family protein [Bacteriovorax sp. PP10]